MGGVVAALREVPAQAGLEDAGVALVVSAPTAGKTPMSSSTSSGSSFSGIMASQEE